MMGLSLWIVPDKMVSEQLEEIMDIRPDSDKSQVPRSLSPRSYPKFYPHITLASLPLSLEGSLDLIERSIKSANLLQICRFASLEIGDHYYRSVYIRIELSSVLERIQGELHEALKVEPRTPVFPHLSLCYIDDVDAAHGERERYRDILEHTNRVRHNQSSTVEIIRAGGEKSECLDHFTVHQIWVVRCEGAVREWDVLRKINVSGI